METWTSSVPSIRKSAKTSTLKVPEFVPPGIVIVPEFATKSAPGVADPPPPTVKGITRLYPTGKSAPVNVTVTIPSVVSSAASVVLVIATTASSLSLM